MVLFGFFSLVWLGFPSYALVPLVWLVAPFLVAPLCVCVCRGVRSLPCTFVRLYASYFYLFVLYRTGSQLFPTRGVAYTCSTPGPVLVSVASLVDFLVVNTSRHHARDLKLKKLSFSPKQFLFVNLLFRSY